MMEALAIDLSQSSGEPLYMRLYRHVSAGISRGDIESGRKLPSKRALSQTLGVSVNTVDAAYQMLVAEGYIEARPKSGYYACRMEKLDAPVPPPPKASEPAEPARGPVCDLNTGSVDASLFPYKHWGRIQRDILSGHPELLNHGAREGDIELRSAIAGYLHEYRGVVCSPDQVVIGAGMEYLLGLIASMFPGSVFALEDPGYPRVANILENQRSGHIFLPVGREGLEIESLKSSGARIVYVTPSHQFPTGATMPISRRQELLAWAGSAEGRYIVEDDYDSEFRFDVRPLPSLQGLDTSGRVIYISTFSRSLCPSIRIACMVLPEALLPLYRSCFSSYSSTVSRFEQHTLCRFIREGHFARHLNRARIAYRSRRDALIKELGLSLGRENIRISGEHTGLHLVLEIRTRMGEKELVQKAAEAGVRLAGLSEYYRENCKIPGKALVLGYSALSEIEIKKGCALLKEAWGF